MIKVLFRVFLFLLPVLFAVSCSENTDDPVPVDPVQEEVGRTVIVYMVANNNLGNGGYMPGEFDLDDIEEMKKAAQAGAFGKNRLILFHSRKGNIALKEISSEGVRLLKSYPSDFMAVDEANMKAVIADVKAMAPARKYGIVLWSHANGWLQTGVPEAQAKMRAFGDDNGRSMNVTALARALSGENFDFVYFDCCFMGGVEVAYQLREATPVVVASVSELPSPGMPYDRTLPFLMAEDADPEGAAAATFRYYDALSGADRTCTMSVIRTDVLPALAAAVRSLYLNFNELPPASRVQQYVTRSDSYYGRFYDLRHYLSCLTGGGDEADGALAYATAVEAINEAVVWQASTPWLWQGDRLYEVEVEWHCGLSTFILQSEADADRYGYRQLDWYRDVASVMFNNN